MSEYDSEYEVAEADVADADVVGADATQVGAPGSAAPVSDLRPASNDAALQFPALASLADLDQRPLAEHADVYQQLHSELQGALAEIDSM